MIQKVIGLLGGSFDPIHQGHLCLALEIESKYRIDEIRFLPCCQNPLKSHSPKACAKDRVHMLQLAIAPFKNFSIDLREIQSLQVSYTIDTLQSLRKELTSEISLAFILSSDILTHFNQWKGWQSILDYVHLIVAHRPGHSLNLSCELETYLQKKRATHKEQLHQFPSGYIFFEQLDKLLAISASQIREAVAHQKNIQGLVPTTVAHYIKAHRLYSAS